MELTKCTKEGFAVIGKEGTTNDGGGFIARLWEEANGNFNQVAHLAKKKDDGSLAGIWGAMSDFTRSFRPWEKNFSEGLYLAGVECVDGAEAPEGWTKWNIPAYEYLYVENSGGDTFFQVMEHFRQQGIVLAGAAHDFTCPATGKGYIYFPVRSL